MATPSPRTTRAASPLFTVVMGASFRNVGELEQLAGCDLLTISPKLLAELEAAIGELPRELSLQPARSAPMDRMTMGQATFEVMHRDTKMATEQLTQGVNGFSNALAGLEQMLAARLPQLDEGHRA